MASVKLKNVWKRFGKLEAVKNFTLDVEDKEFVVLVGPSGCGKSTTLRMIAGLEEITEGTIEIGGKIVNKIPPKDRDIAMVFQNYALYPHMNVFKNMAFGLMLRKFPRSEIEKRVKEAAEILGITELLNRKPRELSGGQRQRVAVGRAIVRKPAVFLFDEPLSNLDAKLRVQMRGELLKLHHQLQTTVIYVTHDQIEAMTMGSKIVIMNSGNIMQVGNPIDVYDYPQNKFVAGFIGSPPMNFMDVELVKEDSKLIIRSAAFSFPVPIELVPKYEKYSGGRFIMGIRPENIYDIEFLKEYSKEYVMDVNVELTEPIGSVVYIQFQLGNNSFIAQVDSHTKAKRGKKIPLYFEMSKVHLFESDPPHKTIG